MSIFPYIYYMIVSFDITSDTRQIAIYVGMVTSAFTFAEFLSGFAWGRISDRVGRKPVLLAGLAGTALSVLVFGFAPSLPVALVARALGGLLNGNIGVIATTVAEIVTVEEHKARGYTIMPLVWCLGSVLGPALGGALAQPCQSFPTFFDRGTLFDRYPFLLPNLFCAIVLAFGVLVGVLFLEETHEELKGRRDFGIEAGRWLLGHFQTKTADPIIVDKAGEANLQEQFALLGDEEPPGYRTTEGSPCQPSTPSQSPNALPADAKIKRRKGPKSKERGVRKAFTMQVILNIAGYGLLAYHSISFDQLMPVFLSEPISTQPVSLPFRFSGGFGLSSKTIGFMLSVQGVYSVFVLILYPVAASHFGTLKTFRAIQMTWPLLYLLVPYLVLLPQRFQMPGVYLCLLWKITAQTFAFTSNLRLINDSVPSPMVLGFINGVAGSTASLGRTLGPLVTGLIHSWSLDIGSTGLAWWACGVVSVVGALVNLYIEKVDSRTDHADVEDDERLADEALIDPLAIDAAINAAGDLPQHLEEGDVEIRKSDSKLNLL